jgi:hypothetical protein
MKRWALLVLAILFLEILALPLGSAEESEPIVDKILSVSVWGWKGEYNKYYVDDYGGLVSLLQEEVAKGECRKFSLNKEYSYSVDVKLYDPSGNLYAKGSVISCPDRDIPGYWTIVFSDGSSVKFYVPPKENKGFSLQAICGPALLVLLSFTPLLLFRRR